MTPQVCEVTLESLLPSIPYGLCQCGCGEKTRVSPRDRKAKGWLAGVPRSFVLGHNPIKTFEEKERGFWSRVSFLSGVCWLWIGFTDENGYGNYSTGIYGEESAHRIAYRLLVGEIPSGLELDHLCRVHNCVNPAHLEAVTPTVNIRRSSRPVINESIAQDIRNSNLSERKLAALLGVSRGTVNYVRSGRGWN